MTTQHYKLYYFVLTFITLGMVCYTVLVGSHHVSYGEQIAQLEAQQRALHEQRVTFTQQLAQEQSITQATELAETHGFVPITRTIAARQSGIVASR